MGKSIYFLARESDFGIFQAWIEKYEIDIVQNTNEECINKNVCLMVFRKEYGNCVLTGRGPDMHKSPAFYLILPYLKSNRFYTIGEFRIFHTTEYMKTHYPVMLKAINELGRIIKKYSLIFDCRLESYGGFHTYDYWLKGSGYEEKMYALPDAYKYLTEGNYFIDGEMNDYVYKNWLNMVALRGDCEQSDIPGLMYGSMNKYFKLID